MAEEENIESLKTKLSESETRVNKILSDHEQEKSTWAETEKKLRAELAEQQTLRKELEGLRTSLSEKSSLLEAANQQVITLQEQIKALTPPAGAEIKEVKGQGQQKSGEGAGVHQGAGKNSEAPRRRYRLI